MRKKSSIILFSSIIILLALLLSCCDRTNLQGNNTSSESKATYEQKIDLLESQILLLMQTQNFSKEEYQTQLDSLKQEISELKEHSLKENQNESTDKNNTSSTPPSQPTDDNTKEDNDTYSFTYTVSNGNAIITGYTGQDDILIIPTSIDGYSVTEISDSAIRSKTIKEIIISTTVTKIGWFAFSECPSLKSITIPENVTKIGYSIFGSSNRSIKIYCYKDSFAQVYAESYGISYTLL